MGTNGSRWNAPASKQTIGISSASLLLGHTTSLGVQVTLTLAASMVRLLPSGSKVVAGILIIMLGVTSLLLGFLTLHAIHRTLRMNNSVSHRTFNNGAFVALAIINILIMLTTGTNVVLLFT